MTGNPNHDEKGKFSTGTSSAQSKVAQSLASYHDASKSNLIDYQSAKVIRDKLDAEVKHTSEILRAFPRGPMNLTPDHVRATPEWRAAREASDHALSKLKRFNGVFVKRFGSEIRAERNLKYNR